MRAKRSSTLYSKGPCLATGDNKMIAPDAKAGERVRESPTGPRMMKELTFITRDFLPDPASPQGSAFIRNSSVVGRYGVPDDVAGAMVYFASDI